MAGKLSPKPSREGFEVDLTLPWPPSANKYLRRARGRTVLSKAARLYFDEAALVVRAAVDRFDRPMRGPVALMMVARPPDNRERDLDNLLKVSIDGIQRAGLIVDDSQVCEIGVRWGRLSSLGGSIDVTLRVMHDSEIRGRAWPGRRRRDRRRG